MKFLRHQSLLPFPYLRGSSSLVLGSDADVSKFFLDTFERFNLGEYAVQSVWTFPVDWVETEGGWLDFVELKNENILSPEELFDLAMQEDSEAQNKILYVPSITRKLVESYNAQYRFNFDFMFDGDHWMETPDWLTEYAILADGLSRLRNFDIFLNLEWDLPKKELPSMFLNCFDRIFECKKSRSGAKIITQTRDIPYRNSKRPVRQMLAD